VSAGGGTRCSATHRKSPKEEEDPATVRADSRLTSELDAVSESPLPTMGGGETGEAGLRGGAFADSVF